MTSIFTGSYLTASSGTCASLGMYVVDTLKECEDAAKTLQLPNTVPYEKQFEDRPIGCYQNPVSHWLGWAEPSGHPNPDVECGSLSQQNRNYDCICSGMIILMLDFRSLVLKSFY